VSQSRQQTSFACCTPHKPAAVWLLAPPSHPNAGTAGTVLGARPWVVGFEAVRWMLQIWLAVASLSYQRAMSTSPAMLRPTHKSYLDLRRQSGGCKPGDSSHALICEPVSACRALRISSSRAAPGGSCRASSRRRFASCANLTSRVVDWMILLRRSMLVSPSMPGRKRTKKVPVRSTRLF
jgi:hypothetical protein